MRKGAARAIEHQMSSGRREMSVERSLSELAEPFVFMARSQKQGC